MLRLCTMPRRPRTTLFPYTTLFRSLTATDGCQQIDDPGGQLIRRGLQLDHLIRERGDQVVEAGPARGLERVHAVDGFDAYQGAVARVVTGAAGLAHDPVAGAQLEALDPAGGDAPH